MYNIEQLDIFSLEYTSINNSKKNKKNKKDRDLSVPLDLLNLPSPNISHQLINQINLLDENLLNKKSISSENNILNLFDNNNLQENLDMDMDLDLDLDMNLDSSLDLKLKNNKKNILTGQQYFFQSINSIPLLSREEEKKYFLEYEKSQKTNKNIKDLIINSNIKLVISLARKYANKTVKLTLDDLIQEGVLGLIKAIDKFEIKRNLKFSTYAFSWIRQGITRAIANKENTIRIPVHFTDGINKIKSCENYLMNYKNKENVTNEEISKLTNIPLKKVKKYKSYDQSITSLDVEIDDMHNTIQAVLPDDKQESTENIIINQIGKQKILEALRTLTPKESTVIIHRYGLSEEGEQLTLEKISIKLGLTKERIRQIENNALKKLRHPSRLNLFKDYYR